MNEVVGRSRYCKKVPSKFLHIVALASLNLNHLLEYSTAQRETLEVTPQFLSLGFVPWRRCKRLESGSCFAPKCEGCGLVLVLCAQAAWK
jgi:hypothetical protein